MSIISYFQVWILHHHNNCLEHILWSFLTIVAKFNPLLNYHLMKFLKSSFVYYSSKILGSSASQNWNILFFTFDGFRKVKIIYSISESPKQPFQVSHFIKLVFGSLYFLVPFPNIMITISLQYLIILQNITNSSTSVE